MYREIILDYYANPRNKGKISKPDVSAVDWNPLCGDKIKMELKFDANRRISESKFDGDGCAISQASASMLTEAIQGMSREEIGAMPELQVLDMIGVPLSPSRKKCGLLGWLVLRKSLGFPLKYAE